MPLNIYAEPAPETDVASQNEMCDTLMTDGERTPRTERSIEMLKMLNEVLEENPSRSS